MELKPVHYLVNEKNRHQGLSIIKGFRADSVPCLDAELVPGALHLIGGLGYGSLELMREVRARREPFVFFDRAYLYGGPGTNRLRVVPNAYQKSWITQEGPQRFERMGGRLEPWRKSGDHIILVPPSEAVTRLFDFGPLFVHMEDRLRRTGRPVIVSRKGDDIARRHFPGAWCVVTWSSNVAVEAICAGIPAFVTEHSAAYPVAGTLDQIEHRMATPPMPDRETWAWSLACGEFDLHEIESGLAKAVILDGEKL